VLRKIVRRGAIALLVLFAAIQLKQPDRTNPPVESDLDAPPEVLSILRRSCYDCHSHQTDWPWYSYVAPVSWWLADHVEHARSHLNFSSWPTYDLEEQEHLFGDIREEVGEDKMPLPSYLILHRDARLSPEEKATLLRWARP
jgi:hypothetical protein